MNRVYDRVQEVIGFLKEYVEKLEDVHGELHYPVENIYDYNIPEEYKDEARLFLQWLRMKIGHLIEEAEYKLEELEERLINKPASPRYQR